MVYVRDRDSTSGTYVNGRLIGGRKENNDSKIVYPGRILRHGDVVTVGENVKFEIIHPFVPKLRLNEVQTKEVLVSLVLLRELFELLCSDNYLAIPRQIRCDKFHDRKRCVRPSQPRH